MNTEKHKQIEQRAYAFWEAEGQPHGRHEEHWHRAARQVEADETARNAQKATAKQAPGRGKAGRKKTKA